jgi:hypothetical protein
MKNGGRATEMLMGGQHLEVPQLPQIHTGSLAPCRRGQRGAVRLLIGRRNALAA